MANIFDYKSAEKLIEENYKISSDIQFTDKCIQLLEKYRKCLLKFRNRCICEENIESESDFNLLELDYKVLIGKEIQNQTKPANQLKTEAINYEDVNKNHKMSHQLTKTSTPRSRTSNMYKNFDPIAVKTNSKVIEDILKDHQTSDQLIQTSIPRSLSQTNDKNIDSIVKFFDDWSDSDGEELHGSDEEFTLRPKKKKHKKKLSNIVTTQKRFKKKLIYICDWIGCERKYTKRDYLMAHISSCHTNNKPFKCEICSKSFAIKKYLTFHRRHHCNPTPGTESNSSGVHSKSAFLCNWPLCGASFKTEEHLMSHNTFHTNNHQFKCDFEGCQRVLQTKWAFWGHKASHHSVDETGRQYKCHFKGCRKLYDTGQQLIKHQEKHDLSLFYP